MPINVKQLGVYIKRGESEHADVPLKVMKKPRWIHLAQP